MRVLERARPTARVSGRLQLGLRVTVTAVVTVVAAGALASFAHGWERGHAEPDPTPPSAGGLGAGVGVAVPAVTSGPTTIAGARYATYVGPDDRLKIVDYVAATRRRLAAAASAPGGGGTDVYAVVSLPGYRTPAQLAGALAGYRLVRVFFRVPPDGAQQTAAVRDPVADVRAAFLNAAAVIARDESGGGSAVSAARDVDQVRALRGMCSCVYGAVVRAPMIRLAALGGSSAIRLVDPGPPGPPAGPATRFVPLRPEQQ